MADRDQPLLLIFPIPAFGLFKLCRVSHRAAPAEGSWQSSPLTLRVAMVAGTTNCCSFRTKLATIFADVVSGLAHLIPWGHKRWTRNGWISVFPGWHSYRK